MYRSKIKDFTSYEIMKCLVASLEVKDIYTSGHSNRVANMVYDICRLMEFKEKEIEGIYIAAQLHDIGKIAVPDYILNKNGPLTKFEWERVKRHPEIGYSILSRSDKLKNIAKIVLYHHERWDGKGYPHGKKAEEIPVGSRIIAICDSIDAMTSDRPYRKRFTITECYEEIQRNKGKQFDPFLIEVIEDLWNKWQGYMLKDTGSEINQVIFSS